jgi:hypothetical protein
VLDTSGSIERTRLAKALGAIASYCFSRDVPAARIVFCDAATANLGDEYVQMQQRFDAALLGRFDAQYTVERLDAETRTQILARYHGLPEDAARAIARLEDETTRHTAAHGGLLVRALNLRVAIAWGLEARAEVEDGARWAEALATAAECTVIPFCCGRDSQGALEAPAVDALRELVRNHAQIV